MAPANEDARPAAGYPDEASKVLPCSGCGCVDRADAAVEQVPEWRKHLDPAGAARLDVRPILAAGKAPLEKVMQVAEGVPAAGILIVEAPFDPQPLRRLLAAKAFSTYGERLEQGHWRIWCRRDEPRGGASAPMKRSAQVWQSDNAVHIDVRGLEAPRPLVAILTLIDKGAHNGTVVVHHEREPLYLYPELEERGWIYERLPSPEGEVRLQLRGPR